jgi:hypothetical protein
MADKTGIRDDLIDGIAGSAPGGRPSGSGYTEVHSELTYLMRGHRISTGLNVYWKSPLAPDLTGIKSGIPLIDISSMVVLGVQ